jgi:adenine-specific DNA-methyltransferase
MENLFQYNPNSPESQRVQETLFHEKQTIIENCLFGVDINPNSVKICRLRLWIELLKNAYYTDKTYTVSGKHLSMKTLETLPTSTSTSSAATHSSAGLLWMLIFMKP